ncbi:anti-sigma-I factor RsgI family protein [Adlercreutzia muris]|uniref:anti-sigma-I factor RsgI family protein n=1 Tax=Adlercreutzia muris TaxID=1796610 RepID=UPI003517E8CF
MTDIEQRLREAYESQHLPAPVRARTLAAIEEARHCQEGGGEVASPQPCAGLASSDEVAESKSLPALPALTPAETGALARQAVASASLRSRRRPCARFVTALAACLLLVLAAFGVCGVYQTPSAYVDIDVNPAIELTVNPFGVVIGADALNDDGRTVLDAVSVLHRPYKVAIDTLMASEVFASYADADAFIDINVVSENDRLGSDLVAQSDAAMASMPCEHACQRTDADTRDAAAEVGLCVGRYQAAQELMELDPSYTLEDCASMSMRQLRDHIDACHSEGAGDEASIASSGSGAHQGRGGGHGGHGRHGN